MRSAADKGKGHHRPGAGPAAQALLLNEPTLHLDINHQFELMELIRSLTKAKGLLVVVLSHDLNLAARYCDKLIVLDEGKITAAGVVGDVLTPDNLVGVFNINVGVEYDERTNAFDVTIPGTILKPGFLNVH